MARLTSGILGGISGTVGNVVGGRWRGIDYIRSKPASVKNPNTEAQQQQRMRFKLVIQFLRKISPLVNIGLSNGSNNRTPMNRGMSLNLKEAITGTFPDLEINWEKLIFSQGNLAMGTNAAADLSVADTVTITWENTQSTSSSSDTDGALVLLSNTDRDEVVYSLHGASRVDGQVDVDIPQEWSGENIACYLSFRSETGKDVSDNQFLGIEVAA
ncbi:DUF6266 family protein [Rhodohalobacter sp. 614A]|uniref:DUF6266 family protein n=1 Tax=Rhodohalobacter sp. 614A TaxID=2908649 RepID=UPI001F2FFB85|nr:DUF6266 family protein [Rhodohalobacter sp. 614A]